MTNRHSCPARPRHPTPRIGIFPAQATTIPDMLWLDDEPQLASIALLQAALPVAQAALDARHGYLGPMSDAILEDGSNGITNLLARIVAFRCRELEDLLVAYRLVVYQAANLPDPPY